VGGQHARFFAILETDEAAAKKKLLAPTCQTGQAKGGTPTPFQAFPVLSIPLLIAKSDRPEPAALQANFGI
jgi:hypothetical protein